jgi:Tol biopolymer transport system component
VDGSTPKQLSPGNAPWGAAAPDGQSLIIFQTEAFVVRSMSDGSSKPIPGIQAEEFPIGWADSKHIFVQAIIATGLRIYKVDVESGRRELWQTITPKDATGLRPMNTPTAITPDGRWMAFGCRTQLGQLYRSDTLK